MYSAINNIKNQLSKTLPGIEAQYTMAPVVREIFSFEPPIQKAGVLFLLYPYQNEVFTVFIKRTEYQGAHSGQISLPGGKFEQGDNDLISTSLRETREEIGINPSEVDIIGELTPLEIPVSSFKVFPFVGYTNQKPDFSPDPAEVEYLIEAELRVLIDPFIRKRKIMAIREFNVDVPYFDYNENHIWGATAMMLAEFLEVLKRAGFPSRNK